ncbi:MAG: hypothetical protein JXK93_05545 [Sphaerochaetaceae bacterium]|nr:hypothetical protein [Sphaerochaetaceae bacterium]
MTIPATLMIPLSLISAFLLFHGAFFSYALGISLFFSLLWVFHLGYFAIQSSAPTLPTFQEMLEWATQIPFYHTLIIVGITFLMTYLITHFCRRCAPYVLILLAPTSVPVGLTFLTHHGIGYAAASSVYMLLVSVLLIAHYRSHQGTAIITSSAAGGIALSLLFSSFYYFTTPVTVTLAIILIGSGVLVQNGTQKKQDIASKREQDNESHD